MNTSWVVDTLKPYLLQTNELFALIGGQNAKTMLMQKSGEEQIPTKGCGNHLKPSPS